MPKAFEEKRIKLMSAIAQAQKDRSVAGDALAVAENQLRAAEDITRKAESELGKTREAHARLEARAEAAKDKKSECRERIVEVLECRPQEVLERAGLEEENLPSQQEVEQQLANLKNQRDRWWGEFTR